jgi:hypothetical protein
MSSAHRRGGLIVTLAVTALAVTAGLVLPANAQLPVVDAAMDAIIKGLTRASKNSKALVAKVVNEGTSTILVCHTDISWDVLVNGVPTLGRVSAITRGCKMLGPGAKARFKSTWTYGAGEVQAGATVVYTATVNVSDDANVANDSDTETRIAK